MNDEEIDANFREPYRALSEIIGMIRKVVTPDTDFSNETYCDHRMIEKPFSIWEFCQHRHESHELRIAFDGKSRRCEKCGLYFELESKSR